MKDNKERERYTDDQGLIRYTDTGAIVETGGRPKGAKNKTTLFKEAMKEGFEKLLEKESKAVFMAVVTKAKEGDMTAAKLILDRVIPVTKAGDGEKGTGATQVVINVSGMEAKVELMDSDNAVDAEFTEVKSNEVGEA